jgi:hypothetical protein
MVPIWLSSSAICAFLAALAFLLKRRFQVGALPRQVLDRRIAQHVGKAHGRSSHCLLPPLLRLHAVRLRLRIGGIQIYEACCND